jgi:hypothetical protein
MNAEPNTNQSQVVGNPAVGDPAATPKPTAPPLSSAWLFPEIALEIKEERSAAGREAAQRVRQEKRRAIKYLRGRDLRWLIDKLVDDGPATEISLLFAKMDGRVTTDTDDWLVLNDLWSLWRVGKLWRKSQGIHFGSGEETFLYGLRGVHEQNTEVS